MTMYKSPYPNSPFMVTDHFMKVMNKAADVLETPSPLPEESVIKYTNEAKDFKKP